MGGAEGEVAMAMMPMRMARAMRMPSAVVAAVALRPPSPLLRPDLGGRWEELRRQPAPPPSFGQIEREGEGAAPAHHLCRSTPFARLASLPPGQI